MRRVVLYGPPLAGKTVLLQAFAKARELTVYRFDPLAKSRPITSEPADQGIYVHDKAGDYSVATIVGAVFSKESWGSLLAKADAVVVVLDPQVAREQADGEFIEALGASGIFPRHGCVVWTKQDIVTDGVETVTASLLHETPLEHWRAFKSRHDDLASLLAPLDWLLATHTR